MKAKKGSVTREVLKKGKRLAELLDQVEGFKEIYNEIDKLTIDLVEVGCLRIDDVWIIDNFATKNTAFKTTAIKRFEAKKVA